MTGNLKKAVSVHLANPAGFVAQKNRPETNLCAALAGGDEKRCFSSGVHSEEEMPFGGVKASGYGRFGGKTGVVELQSCDGSALRPPRSTARSDLSSRGCR